MDSIKLMKDMPEDIGQPMLFVRRMEGRFDTDWDRPLIVYPIGKVEYLDGSFCKRTKKNRDYFDWDRGCTSGHNMRAALSFVLTYWHRKGGFELYFLGYL